MRGKRCAVAAVAATSLLVTLAGGATQLRAGPVQDVRVVFYNDLGVTGNLSAPYLPTDEVSTHDDRVNLVKTIKALNRHFARRYASPGRRIVLVGQASSGLGDENRSRDAQTAVLKYGPFAAVGFGENLDAYAAELARRGVMFFGIPFHASRALFVDHAPYVWSVMPDADTEVSFLSSFVCERLAGGTARYADDPMLASQTRRFGFVYERFSPRGPQVEQMAARLILDVEQRCGLDLDDRDGGTSRTETIAYGAPSPAVAVMSRMKLNPDRAGLPRPTMPITTIICYCVVVPPELTVAHLQTAASTLAYEPEWVFDQVSAMDRAVWVRAYTSRTAQMFGVTPLWRMHALEQTPAYGAFQEETADGSRPNARYLWHIYHTLELLYRANAGAGARLTPERVAAGLASWTSRSGDPFQPGGGFEAGKPNRYAFIDTAMGWWWDPAGAEPGEQAGQGCHRVLDGGRRFVPGGWAASDADLYSQSAPCTAGPFRTSPF